MRTRATLTDLTPREATTTDAHLVISLAGEDTGSQRPRIGIVPVVDRSGSMGTAGKLAIVTRALGHLSTYLGDDDHVALVSFDSVVETPLTARLADQAGVAAFTRALAALASRGSTHLEGGIRHGLAQAGAMPADTIVRVIVLTDGRANAGETSREALLALVSDLPGHVSVSFLGVGTDCDHDLLGALAAAGRGSYGFIEAADRAADVLGTEVGGLLETEVHRVRVEVSARRTYATLGDPLGVAFTRDDDTTAVVVEYPTLLVGQTRHLVIPVTLRGPKRKHARPVTVADVVVTGVIDETTVEVEMLPKAHFGADAADYAEALAGLEDAFAAVELAELADAQRKAEQAAAVGDFAAARNMFAGLNLHTGAALGMHQALAATYNDSNTYAASATMRSSSTHVFTGSLAGSGEAFDALAARTIGSYTTAGQRDVASATAQAAGPASVSVTNPAVGAGVADLSTLTAGRLGGQLSDAVSITAAGHSRGTDTPTVDGEDGDEGLDQPVVRR